MIFPPLTESQQCNVVVIPENETPCQSNSKVPNKTSLLNEHQQKFIIEAVQTKIPSTLGHSITLVLDVFSVVKSLIADDARRKSKHLCKFTDGSVLLPTKDIKTMTEFSTNSIWSELLTHQPFLVSIFSAVAGSTLNFDDIPEEIRITFCFVYSILMNIKWDKLSLLQRINTVAMLEGGGSKKVKK